MTMYAPDETLSEINRDPVGDVVRVLVSRFLQLSSTSPKQDTQRANVGLLLRELIGELEACVGELDRGAADEKFDVTRERVERVIADRSLARNVRLAAPAMTGLAPSRTTFQPMTTMKACPDCGGAVALTTGKFGAFMGCVKYPACRGTLRASLEVSCPLPECSGHLVEKSKDGLNGGFQSYVGCSEYKTKGQGCSFVVWSPPERVPCHRCGLPFVLHDVDGRRCIDPRCVSEADVDQLNATERVERIMKYVLRPSEPVLKGAASVTTAAGLMCGMADATQESAIRIFTEAYTRGAEWLALSRPGAIAAR